MLARKKITVLFHHSQLHKAVNYNKLIRFGIILLFIYLNVIHLHITNYNLSVNLVSEKKH